MRKAICSIGTEPDGLILRLKSLARTAQLCRMPALRSCFTRPAKKKSPRFLTDAAGNLYASTIGEKNRAPCPCHFQSPFRLRLQQPQHIASPQQSGIIDRARFRRKRRTQRPIFAFPRLPHGGAEVMKIAPDGSPESLWTSREELVFAMALSPAGKILLGTGNKGAIIELEGRTCYSSCRENRFGAGDQPVPEPGRQDFCGHRQSRKNFTIGPGL